MAKRYEPTEYLYASARIRAMEAHLTRAEMWNQLLQMQSVAEIRDALADKGGDPEAALRAAFTAVADSVPDKALVRFLQYPYDCNNLKAMEKCRIRGLDPSDLLVDLGSIPVKTLQTVSENELLAQLPTHMAAAVREARESYEKTADPQEIDFILDRAAFADMQEAAAPYPFAAKLVCIKADLHNLMICLRLLAMGNGDLGRSMLERAALPGGSIVRGTLLHCYDQGINAFYDMVFDTPYAKIFDKAATPADTERAADNYLMQVVREARSITFGVEIPIAYLMATENESKNLRILLAGKTAGWDDATIRAKLRESYV